MPRPPQIEKRQAAFNLYLKCRNLLQVSRELDIPAATLHVWKRDGQWDEKILNQQQLLSHYQGVLQKAQENLQIDSQITELKLLEFLEAKVAELLLSENVRPTSWKDVLITIDFVTKQKRLIMGEPTERGVHTIEASAMKEKDLDDEIQRLAKIVGEPADAAVMPAAIAPIKEGSG